mmetsp:Transcript_136044/g.379162  ORF Transcript_136044/g.379162 Transcript_136044/m.379162 type:complete len:220 (-) Transcript_136044:569-1228(-)
MYQGVALCLDGIGGGLEPIAHVAGADCGPLEDRHQPEGRGELVSDGATVLRGGGLVRHHSIGWRGRQKVVCHAGRRELTGPQPHSTKAGFKSFERGQGLRAGARAVQGHLSDGRPRVRVHQGVPAGGAAAIHRNLQAPGNSGRLLEDRHGAHPVLLEAAPRVHPAADDGWPIWCRQCAGGAVGGVPGQVSDGLPRLRLPQSCSARGSEASPCEFQASGR